MINVELREVINLFGLEKVIAAENLEGGKINVTYLIQTTKQKVVLQKLNHAFNKKVVQNYKKLEDHLSNHGIQIPKSIKAKSGDLAVKRKGSLWRCFEYIDHDFVEETRNPEVVFEAGKILGKFHNAMQTFNGNIEETIEGFHDTKEIVRKLQRYTFDSKLRNYDDSLQGEMGFILGNITKHYLPDNHSMIIHADPKITNILFKDSKALALIDLDTVMEAHPLIDLGDAFRSWCRVNNCFNEELFREGFIGYTKERKEVYSSDEIRNAVGLITLELAARYAIDYFEDKHFNIPKHLKKENTKKYIAYYKTIYSMKFKPQVQVLSTAYELSR